MGFVSLALIFQFHYCHSHGFCTLHQLTDMRIFFIASLSQLRTPPPSLNSSTPPNNSSYKSILQSSIQNKRFITESTPKPSVIITPHNASQILATISCSLKHEMQVRVRSGGHDFEGLSHYSNNPFVIVDLVNMRNVSVDLSDKTTWIQAGELLGEVYYRIAEKSRTLAFPAGVCPTVGVGVHFSGGGYGMMMRKYALAADHIIDAHFIDVKGRILDRAAMREDLFRPFVAVEEILLELSFLAEYNWSQSNLL